MVKSNLIFYPFFCFISFFVLYSNVRWRKVLKRTIMLLHFTFLILSKYDLPIRWALSRFESGISKFDSAQVSFNFYYRPSDSIAPKHQELHSLIKNWILQKKLFALVNKISLCRNLYHVSPALSRFTVTFGLLYCLYIRIKHLLFT